MSACLWQCCTQHNLCICACEAGGVHVIQACFSEDRATEVQVQGRTARQGKSGTYSLILAESEVRDPKWLALDPARLQNMQAENVYHKELCVQREKRLAVQSQKIEETLKEADDLDNQSHAYFNALLEGDCPLAKTKLMELRKKLGQGSSVGCSGYHIVCCYDDSGSMQGSPWDDLMRAHRALMQSVLSMPVRVSIVQFGDSAQTVLQLADGSQALQSDLHFRLRPDTRFQPPLASALQLMRSGHQQFPGLTPLLLFMSDGHNGDGDCIGSITQMQREFPTAIFHAVIFRLKDSPVLRGMMDVVKGQFHVSIDGVKLLETFSTIASGLEYTGRA